MGIELDRARAFLRGHDHGVLATLKRDGRAQLSTILYTLGADGRVLISVTQDRAKTHNLRRDPRVTLHVQGRNPYEYVVVDGRAELLEGDGLAEQLRDYYRRARGEHPDWADYDAAMIRDRRLLLAFAIDKAYGLMP